MMGNDCLGMVLRPIDAEVKSCFFFFFGASGVFVAQPAADFLQLKPEAGFISGLSLCLDSSLVV